MTGLDWTRKDGKERDVTDGEETERKGKGRSGTG